MSCEQREAQEEAPGSFDLEKEQRSHVPQRAKTVGSHQKPREKPGFPDKLGRGSSGLSAPRLHVSEFRTVKKTHFCCLNPNCCAWLRKRCP